MRFGPGGSIVDDGEFDFAGLEADRLICLASKVVDARDCAVVLEQQLAEAERLLRAATKHDNISIRLQVEIDRFLDDNGAL